jgi:tetratricopeptide (TPR) repeat protein
VRKPSPSATAGSSGSAIELDGSAARGGTGSDAAESMWQKGGWAVVFLLTGDEIMGILRGRRTLLILLAACMAFAGTAQAACTGPQALMNRMRAHPTSENAILLGSWFAVHNQYECAVKTFHGALSADPGSAQLHYLEGLALIGWGHTGEAIPALQESIRRDPKALKPHLTLADLYDQTEQRPLAEEQWKQALGIDPHSEAALEGLSDDLLARKDYIGVVLLLQNAPRTEKLTINLAHALGLLNHVDAAGAVLNEALKLSPDSLPLSEALTVVLIKQLRNQDAINLSQLMVQKHPGSQEAEVQLFRVLVLTSHINEARPMGPRLLAKRPHDPEVLYLNGVVDRSVGDNAQAKAHLEAAVAIDPDIFISRYSLGMVLVSLHEWKEGAEQLEKAIALGAPQPQVHFELAKALRGLGENSRALEEMKLYQQLEKSNEAGVEAQNSAIRGDEELEAGKVKEALAHYREATEGAPNNAGYKYKLALALDQAGDTKSERAELEKAIKLNPGLAGAQQQLGHLLALSGDADGAIEHFRLAVQAAPAWVEAWINLGGALAEAGQFPAARDAAATALRLEPGNAEARELSDQLARDSAAQQAQP